MKGAGLSLRARLKAVGKLLRGFPYVLVPVKSADMLRPRSGTHVFEPVKQAIDANAAAIDKLLAEVKQQQPAALQALDGLLANPYFPPADSMAAFALLAHWKPKRVVEIGSGYSTHVMRRAAKHAGLDLHITCIDPEPRADLAGAADRFIRQNVTECAPDLADGLERGDILFVDGSHYVFNGTDVPFLVLEVMPRLKPGVIVHFHDICLPFEYVEGFSERNYNEQYMLAACLLGGGYTTLFPVHYLHRQGRSGPGFSFWMVKQG